MPPKKEVVAGEALLSGFQDKETKLLAAAFLSSTAPDKVCHIMNGVYYMLTWIVRLRRHGHADRQHCWLSQEDV